MICWSPSVPIPHASFVDDLFGRLRYQYHTHTLSRGRAHQRTSAHIGNTESSNIHPHTHTHSCPHTPPSQYRQQRMNRMISPDRGGDAFAGKTPVRSYKDIMMERNLEAEKSKVDRCYLYAPPACWHKNSFTIRAMMSLVLL